MNEARSHRPTRKTPRSTAASRWTPNRRVDGRRVRSRPSGRGLSPGGGEAGAPARPAEGVEQGVDPAPCRPGRPGALARDRAGLAEPDQRDAEAGGRVGRGTATSGCAAGAWSPGRSADAATAKAPSDAGSLRIVGADGIAATLDARHAACRSPGVGAGRSRTIETRIRSGSAEDRPGTGRFR